MKSVLLASIVSLYAVGVLPIDAGSAEPAFQNELDASYNRGYEYGAAITACMNYERGFLSEEGVLLVLLRTTGMNTISAPEKAHLFNMLRRDYPKCAAHLAKFGV